MSSQLRTVDVESGEQADLIVKSNSSDGGLIDIDHTALAPYSCAHT